MASDASLDARLYGKHAADIIIGSKRAVALADAATKLATYRDAVADLAAAVADQWIPKDRATDVAHDLAMANDFFGLGPDDIQAMISDAFALVEKSQHEMNSQFATARQLIVHRACDLKPEKLKWIWPGRIAEGKLILIGGQPGLGKSMLALHIAATISRGGDWPCGEGRAPAGDVIILSAEDGVKDTIVPRLIAADADMKRIHIVEAKMDGQNRKTLNLKADVDLLESRIKALGNVLAVIVDPISAYLGGTDTHKNADTRDALEPLVSMSDRLGVATLLVTHLNKSGGGGGSLAINRLSGSIAFAAVARAVFGVVEDYEIPERRLFLQGKNNLSTPCKGLAYRVEQRLISDDLLASYVSFEREHVAVSFGEALAAVEGGDREPSSTDEAEAFLLDLLANGPMEVADVEHAARAAGLLAEGAPLNGSKPFRRARQRLGILTQRVGFGKGGCYTLTMPTNMEAPKTHGRPSGY